jgi:hypothetical protein
VKKYYPKLCKVYERSDVHLDSKQKKVDKLLSRNVDVFSTGPDDLGQTDKVQHRIETGDTPPVKQPARRLPRAKQEEAMKAIDSMREQEVIEPSHSPWSTATQMIFMATPL